MDAFLILRHKLRSIERFYNIASDSFAEIKRKIEAGEAPFEPPPFDPEYDDTEPPFTEEWIEADEFQNVVGQAAITLLHSALKDYLDDFLERDGLTRGAEKYFVIDERTRPRKVRVGFIVTWLSFRTLTAWTGQAPPFLLNKLRKSIWPETICSMVRAHIT
jgi:hypothetical protein